MPVARMATRDSGAIVGRLVGTDGLVARSEGRDGAAASAWGWLDRLDQRRLGSSGALEIPDESVGGRRRPPPPQSDASASTLGSPGLAGDEGWPVLRSSNRAKIVRDRSNCPRVRERPATPTSPGEGEAGCSARSSGYGGISAAWNRPVSVISFAPRCCPTTWAVAMVVPGSSDHLAPGAAAEEDTTPGAARRAMFPEDPCA